MEGRRCNCSICIRKGTVMSAQYFPPEDFEEIQGMSTLSAYRFGDKSLSHYFCRTCGISPFSVVISVPLDYDGPAKPGFYRINLGCVHDLDVYGLTISIIDGKSF